MHCIVHGIANSWTQLSNFHFTSLHLFSFYLAVFTSVSLLSPIPSSPCLWFYHKWQREIRWHFDSIAWKFLALSIQPCCLKLCFLHSCRTQLTALCFLPAGWGSTFLQLTGACFSLSSVTGHRGSVCHPLKCLGNEYTKYFWLKWKYLLFVTRDREMAYKTLSPKTGRWVMFSALSAYIFMTEWV